MLSGVQGNLDRQIPCNLEVMGVFSVISEHQNDGLAFQVDAINAMRVLYVRS